MTKDIRAKERCTLELTIDEAQCLLEIVFSRCSANCEAVQHLHDGVYNKDGDALTALPQVIGDLERAAETYSAIADRLSEQIKRSA